MYFYDFSFHHKTMREKRINQRDFFSSFFYIKTSMGYCFKSVKSSILHKYIRKNLHIIFYSICFEWHTITFSSLTELNRDLYPISDKTLRLNKNSVFIYFFFILLLLAVKITSIAIPIYLYPWLFIWHLYNFYYVDLVWKMRKNSV